MLTLFFLKIKDANIIYKITKNKKKNSQMNTNIKALYLVIKSKLISSIHLNKHLIVFKIKGQLQIIHMWLDLNLKCLYVI